MTQATIFDFEPEKIKHRQDKQDEDERVMTYLSSLSAEQIKNRLIESGGHPKPEWGDGETWRFYYLDECRRRGTKLLGQLGWPIDEKSEYVNLHTGCIQTLWEVATSCGYFADCHTIPDQVWSVIEDWEPYDPTKPNTYLIQYLTGELERLYQIKSKKKLDSYQKSELKKIPEYEKLIQEEKLRGDPNK